MRFYDIKFLLEIIKKLRHNMKELLKHCKEKNSLSYDELKLMTPDELKKVIIIVWKDDVFRDDAVGINSIKLNKSYLDFNFGNEYDEGHANLNYRFTDEKIHKLTDGAWSYGVYKPFDTK
jgi:hypothetical protein